MINASVDNKVNPLVTSLVTTNNNIVTGDLDSGERHSNRDGIIFYSDPRSLDVSGSGSSILGTSTGNNPSSLLSPLPTNTSSTSSLSSTPLLYDGSLGDEVAIRSYTGLSANTQVRFYLIIF